MYSRFWYLRYSLRYPHSILHHTLLLLLNTSPRCARLETITFCISPTLTAPPQIPTSGKSGQFCTENYKTISQIATTVARLTKCNNDTLGNFQSFHQKKRLRIFYPEPCLSGVLGQTRTSAAHRRGRSFASRPLTGKRLLLARPLLHL